MCPRKIVPIIKSHNAFHYHSDFQFCSWVEGWEINPSQSLLGWMKIYWYCKSTKYIVKNIKYIVPDNEFNTQANIKDEKQP